MKIAIISLPLLRLPGGNVFHTLHGYWKPPPYVVEFWTSGSKVEYVNDEVYEVQKEEVLESHKECVARFWRENVL